MAISLTEHPSLSYLLNQAIDKTQTDYIALRHSFKIQNMVFSDGCTYLVRLCYLNVTIVLRKSLVFPPPLAKRLYYATSDEIMPSASRGRILFVLGVLLKCRK